MQALLVEPAVLPSMNSRPCPVVMSSDFLKLKKYFVCRRVWKLTSYMEDLHLMHLMLSQLLLQIQNY